MKKSLVALAALTATGAFAQVTISGLFDAGYQSLDLKGNKVTQASASNGSATTAVVFGIVEDLGGGLKFNGRYEIDPALTETSNVTKGTSATGTTSNTPSSIGNGMSFVGLESASLGQIRFGAINTQTLAANGDGNQGLGTAVGSGYRVSSFDAVRFQNSLAYNTPVFNGFSAQYIMVAKNDKQANAGTVGMNGNQNNQTYGRDAVTELGLTYANGPLTVRYADLETKQWAGVNQAVTSAGDSFMTASWAAGTGAKFNLKTLSAKYDVNSSLSLSFFNQKASSDTLNNASSTKPTVKYDRKTNGFAASYMLTPMLKLTGSRQEVKIGDETNAGTDNTKTTVTGLGADYSFSKRTALYVRYERDADAAGVRSITGYTAATGNTTYKATAVGIRHTF